MPIRCEIVSQDRVVFSGDADIVILPGVEGEMGILPNHAPLLTALRYGIIVVRKQGEEQFFTVAGGIAEVQPDQVTVLADAAENVLEINVQRAEAAKRRAEEMLQRGIPKESDEYFELQAALRRSNLRLEAVQRYRQRVQRERRE
ncbi:ATP synthase F0F1 subunit epsilon [Thermanaerothrix daxensis]|uniref:ATP synthase epsilon chain n=1 Tax=Thermanaerothrix daxensis TaxID=869279 RepID=A0A0P6XHK6_9CHLR|nr:F0F1 ATP synthase subunit epsilon [Thermanaerothrix daxensis]KPL82702.1 ATP synthase F0F1 subunit epsilon [Thermanaerothrix daxensis]